MQYVGEAEKYEHYKKMKIVEFCDFIVRIAHFKFALNNGLSSIDKVEKILDILFDLVGMKRIS
jgi:hypothetical protein